MSNHEIYFLESMKRRYWRTKTESGDLLSALKKLSDEMEEEIVGYYRLTENKTFKEKDYHELQRRISLHILQLLIEQRDWKKNAKHRKELIDFILMNIKAASSREVPLAFNDLLMRKKFFEIEDLRIFYIKQLINFRLGRYENVVFDTEELRKDISFVKKEHLKDYADILLLLADAYISSRLLTRAVATLEEIEKYEPDLVDLFWRMMKIERILGPETWEKEKKREKYELIRGSGRIELDDLMSDKPVYLIESGEIEIDFSEALQKKIEDRFLFQVFVNGEIHHEAYLNQLELPLRLTLPFDKEPRRVTLRFRII